MSDIRNWLIVVLLLACLYFGYQYFHKVPVTDDKPYIDRIHKLDSLGAVYRQEVEAGKRRFDSLQLEKQKVKLIYREKYVFVHTADIDQLDSIIRKSAGLSPKEVLYH